MSQGGVKAPAENDFLLLFMKPDRKEKRNRRHRRVRAKIKGSPKIPRLSVFCSNKHLYAQLIDDISGRTIVSVSDSELKKKSRKRIEEERKDLSKGKSSLAHEIGKLIGQRAKEKKIERIVFDRGGYKYHGRVRALAEGAREGGLIF